MNKQISLFFCMVVCLSAAAQPSFRPEELVDKLMGTVK